MRHWRPTRRQVAWTLVPTALVVIVILLALAFAPAESQGPLRPVEVVNSYGFPVQPGQTFSFVVWHRSEKAATATLRAVELVDADPRLEVVGSGISSAELQAPFVGQFPPGPLMPIDGIRVTTDPDDPSTDITIVLGLRANAEAGRLAARGLWLTYEVDGRLFRARLPWLLQVCIEPVETSCDAQDPSEYESPN